MTHETTLTIYTDEQMAAYEDARELIEQRAEHGECDPDRISRGPQTGEIARAEVIRLACETYIEEHTEKQED